MDVHKRKIQQFAKYSYAVTLPIHWIKHQFSSTEKNRDKVNHKRAEQEDDIQTEDMVVDMYEMPDGSLQLYSSGKLTPKQHEIEHLDLDEFLRENPNFIKDKFIKSVLISFYMNGSIGVEIVSKNPIPEDFIAQIEKTQTRLLLNWNMTRISSRHISIKNLFQETPDNFYQDEIPRYLRESFIILHGMIEDFLTACEGNTYDILTSIADRDDKIDRNYFFIVRQIRNFFENPFIKKPLNYSHKKLIDLRLLAKIIEDVGDLMKEVASILHEFKKFIQILDLRAYIIEFFKELLDGYNTLADLLSKNVSFSGSVDSKHAFALLPWIQEKRLRGKLLLEKWDKYIAGTPIITEKFTFQEYYKASILINNLQSIYLKIFEFSNLFI